MIYSTRFTMIFESCFCEIVNSLRKSRENEKKNKERYSKNLFLYKVHISLNVIKLCLTIEEVSFNNT